jgi:hypothetical protein
MNEKDPKKKEILRVKIQIDELKIKIKRLRTTIAIKSPFNF